MCGLRHAIRFRRVFHCWRIFACRAYRSVRTDDVRATTKGHFPMSIDAIAEIAVPLLAAADSCASNWNSSANSMHCDSTGDYGRMFALSVRTERAPAMAIIDDAYALIFASGIFRTDDRPAMNGDASPMCLVLASFRRHGRLCCCYWWYIHPVVDWLPAPVLLPTRLLSSDCPSNHRRRRCWCPMQRCWL